MIVSKKKHIIYVQSLIFIIALFISSVTIAQSDKFVKTSDDVMLRIIEAGPTDAQTIVLVPGWPFTADIWNKQIAALGNQYHIVAFDPRSQGSSTILNHSNSPDDRAADIANLIGKLKLQKPVIVGWSQGVQDVAAYVLANGTEQISGIVLVDALVSGGIAKLDCNAAAMTFGRMPVYVKYQREYLEGMMPYIFKKQLSLAELNTIVTSAMHTPTSIGVANLMLDFFGKDYRPAYKKINVPTLLIVAGTAPDKNEQLQQQIPNVTTAVVEGAGHAVFYDEPGKFNDALVQFLKERVETKK